MKKPSINIISNIIYIIIIACIIFIFNKQFENNVNKTINNEIKILKNKQDSLNNKLDSLKKEIKKYNRIHISKVANVKIPKTFTNDKLKVLVNSCKKYNVPIKLVCRLIYAESTFKESALSYAGARGYMQLMPNTIKYISRITNIKQNDKYWNIKMGTYYISYIYKKFKKYNPINRWKLTILSYNLGPSRVKSKPKYYLKKYKNYPYLNKILGSNKLGNI